MSELANADFHNFSLFGIGKPSAKQLERQRNRAIKKDPMTQVTGCVKPEKRGLISAALFGGVQQATAMAKYKKDMAAYKKCLAAYKEKVMQTGSATEIAKVKKAETEADAEEAEALKSAAVPVPVEEEKLLGMPKKVAYVVIAVGFVALAFGGYKAYKHFKK